MPKYIEIEVPDTFDDMEKTTFDALDCAIATYPASPVSQGELLVALKAIDSVIRENLAWLVYQLDSNLRRNDREMIGRLEQLATGWDCLCEVIAAAERKEIDIAHEASAGLRQRLKQSVEQYRPRRARTAAWFADRWRTLAAYATKAVRRVTRARRDSSK